MVVRMLARSPRDSSTQLTTHHQKLMQLLGAEGIHPVSKSADGAIIEQKLQCYLASNASDHLRIRVANSIATFVVILVIPLNDGHPEASPQDSAHGKKMARNQLFSGARLLAFGDCATFYSEIHEIALDPSGPLFIRDVEHVDCQDDRAAARLFASPTLQFLSEKFPKRKALATYLFINGKITDAWQNRHIPPASRACMVLRGLFFYISWHEFMEKHPNHAIKTHFVSRKWYAIVTNLCHSFLSLLIIYCNYFPNYPFLPWLHLVEPIGTHLWHITLLEA
jgi:hypothetical protein